PSPLPPGAHAPHRRPLRTRTKRRWPCGLRAAPPGIGQAPSPGAAILQAGRRTTAAPALPKRGCKRRMLPAGAMRAALAVLLSMLAFLERPAASPVVPSALPAPGHALALPTPGNEVLVLRQIRREAVVRVVVLRAIVVEAIDRNGRVRTGAAARGHDVVRGARFESPSRILLHGIALCRNRSVEVRVGTDAWRTVEAAYRHRRGRRIARRPRRVVDAGGPPAGARRAVVYRLRLFGVDGREVVIQGRAVELGDRRRRRAHRLREARSGSRERDAERS